MSIEEKAKAYDEALKRARAMHDVNYTDSYTKANLETIFPEFRESEDEKIRKDLIYDIERLPMQGVLTHRPTSEYITYLKKQEQNPADKEQDSIAFLEQYGYTIVPPHAPVSIVPSSEATFTEWSEEDEIRLTNTLIMLKEYAIHHYSKDDVNKSVDWLENRFKSLCPRPSWKPSEEQMNGFFMVLYQPQYISNSDDERLKQAESLYEQLKKL